MTGLLNRVKCFTGATGTSDATVGAAFSTKHMTPAEAGAIDGKSYVWLYEQGNDFEIVRGVYTASGTVAARTTVLWAKASGTVSQTKLTLNGTATISIVAAAEDYILAHPPVAKSSGFTVAAGDRDTLFVCTSSFTVAFTAAATLGNLHKTRFVNVGTGVITLDPNSTETIDGATTIVLWPGESAQVECDGSAFYTNRGRVRTARGADIASAATLNLDTATGDLVDVTGTTTVTAITLADGKEQYFRAAGVFTLTENSVIDINGGGSNVTLAVGDLVHCRGYSGGVVKAYVTRVSGKPVVPSTVFSDATEATGVGTTAGALFAGGVEIAKKLFVTGATAIAGLFTVSNTTEATGAGTTASAIFSGGVEILKKLYVTGATAIAGVVSITNNSASSSTTTGALVLTAGGLGVAGAGCFGNHLGTFGASYGTVIVDVATATDPRLDLKVAGALKWRIWSSTASSNALIVGDAGEDNGVQLAQNAGSWTTFSDGRMKNIHERVSVLDKISEWQLYEFSWKRNGNHDVGPIAQDIADAFPAMIIRGDDDATYEPKKLDDPRAWKVMKDYAGLYAMQGLKELLQRVENLEKEIIDARRS